MKINFNEFIFKDNKYKNSNAKNLNETCQEIEENKVEF